MSALTLIAIFGSIGPWVASAKPAEEWLRGTTHVHAQPSGDSVVPVEGVVRWYEDHKYDFIVLTDHNRVTDPGNHSRLIVIAGSELTHNRNGCEEPLGDGTCRIHVNAIGPTARPVGKFAWTDYHEKNRFALYARAFDQAVKLGAPLIQVNHPNWHWGMTSELLTRLANRGAKLVEIANSQFQIWNAGDSDHPSLESQWDAVLSTGAMLWGVASDDAHNYEPAGGGKYPAGGGWVVVHARRNPQAILDALSAGRFYASTGVTLSRAEADNDELVVKVEPDANHTYTIEFIEQGKVVSTENGLSGRRQIPRDGYVRAVVTRDDGKKAWVQPVRR
jgi:hypothetical protein